MKKTFYEFFAGGGMAHAGLGKGWECLFANDYCEMKAAAYAANWGRENLAVQDVATVSTLQLPGVADLAWASFPCQDLSLAGNGAGLDGERSGTFWSLIRLLQQLDGEGRKPHLVALENVYGAITSHSGKDFEAMTSALVGLGYRVGAMVMDAVHFLPQSRPRLFVVAARTGFDLPLDTVQAGPNAAWHPDAIIRAYNRLPMALRQRWIWWNLPQPKVKPKILDDLVEKEPTGVDWHSPEQTANLLSMMSPVNRAKVIQAQRLGAVKVGTVYRRTREGVQRAEVRFDGVAGCLRTPSGGSSRQTLLIVDGPIVRSRLLSPREAARLMGLKDSYRLPSRYNDAYHLAGDGIAVPVVAHLSKHLFSKLVAAARSEPGEAAKTLKTA